MLLITERGRRGARHSAGVSQAGEGKLEREKETRRKRNKKRKSERQLLLRGPSSVPYTTVYNAARIARQPVDWSVTLLRPLLLAFIRPSNRLASLFRTVSFHFELLRISARHQLTRRDHVVCRRCHRRVSPTSTKPATLTRSYTVQRHCRLLFFVKSDIKRNGFA